MSVKRKIPAKTDATFTSQLEPSTNKLWGAHVRVPAHIASRFSTATGRRVVCQLNDLPPKQCALVAYTKGSYVVTVNAAQRRLLGIPFGSDVRVTLSPDGSTYGLPMPAEFGEVLRQDPKAAALFNALTPGRKRTLLHIIGSAKSVDTRISRSLVIADHLMRNLGTINYRALGRELRPRTT